MEQIIENIDRALKDYPWFVGVGFGEDNLLIIYIANNGMCEKSIIKKVLHQYSVDYFEIVKAFPKTI